MVKMTKVAMKVLYSVIIFTMLISLITPVFGFTDPKGVTSTETTAFDDYISRILGVVQAIGIGVAVVILVVIGIKYMMGSAEEKADYKKTMIPYVVGAALIGTAPSIASAVYNAFK